MITVHNYFNIVTYATMSFQLFFENVQSWGIVDLREEPAAERQQH